MTRLVSVKDSFLAPPLALQQEPGRASALPGRMAVLLSLVVLVIVPYLMPEGMDYRAEKYWLGLFAKYMSFAVLALSVELVWGYTGLLSLGQGMYFGLGGYMVAYSLTLKRAAEEQGVAVGLAPPQFMQYTGPAPNDPSYVVPPALSWIAPLGNAWTAIVAAALVPAVIALLFGLYTFRPRLREKPILLSSVLAFVLVVVVPFAFVWWTPISNHPILGGFLVCALTLVFAGGLLVSGKRISGVYFALVTQALLLAVFYLIRNQQRFTGGVVGIKHLSDLELFGQAFNLNRDIRSLCFLVSGVLVTCYLACSLLVNSKFGRILTAIRDNENRVLALGYNTAIYKTFVFALAGGLAGLAGGLFVVANGSAGWGPTFLEIPFSIVAVIWVAVGGRGTLLGALVGALLVNFAENLITSAFPGDFWPIILGLLFIGVVLFVHRGLVPLAGPGALLGLLFGVIGVIYLDAIFGMPKTGRALIGCPVILGCLLSPALVKRGLAAVRKLRASSEKGTQHGLSV
ncbi:MAG: hypothetical protein KatS3mg105_0266 [Gemmatales bacterium]|nr:MAG: hypothetical protein KatS3mg105_0266 [Gemmatales bacterium]